MGIKSVFKDTSLARYIHAVHNTPRQILCNQPLMGSAAIYAMCGVTLTWDQGSSSLVPSLPGFAETFGISSGANAKAIANFISVVYIGAGVGAFASFFINDTIGRLWSMRLYTLVWIIGQIIATFSNGSLPALYVARVIAGLGIGAHTVTGPLSLVEIAPTEIRGLITVWFSVVLLLTLFLSTITVYGISLHVAVGKLQYQIVWFAPCIFLAVVIGLSFFAYESPRWLVRAGRIDEARRNLSALRGMDAETPRVKNEFDQIIAELDREHARTGMNSNIISWKLTRLSFVETFTVKANIRRVMQTCISYGLAQLSGANSVTSYFIPIMKLIGTAGDSHHSLFLSSMYSLAKFFFTLIASFFLIDALGRRGSLFTGITIQMISDIYIGIFLKYRAVGDVTTASSEAAIAMIFLHGFGYTIGLLVLPYVFSSEVWPNHLRSFGSSVAQTFHWLFYYGVSRGTPSILSSMDNWGAFIFFAGWCFISLIYVFLMVPETAGYSLEELDRIFEGSWFMAFRAEPGVSAAVIDGQKVEPEDQESEALDSSARLPFKSGCTEQIRPKRDENTAQPSPV